MPVVLKKYADKLIAEGTVTQQEYEEEVCNVSALPLDTDTYLYALILTHIHTRTHIMQQSSAANIQTVGSHPVYT